MAAGVQLTTEAAKGAAFLASQGKAIRVWVEVAGRTRFCFLETLEDEDAQQAWLICETNGRRAPMPLNQIRVAEATKHQCLLAYSRSQAKAGETAGARMGREAAESGEVLNARLWAAMQLRRKGGSLGYCAGRGYGK